MFTNRITDFELTFPLQILQQATKNVDMKKPLTSLQNQLWKMAGNKMVYVIVKKTGNSYKFWAQCPGGRRFEAVCFVASTMGEKFAFCVRVETLLAGITCSKTRKKCIDQWKAVQPLPSVTRSKEKSTIIAQLRANYTVLLERCRSLQTPSEKDECIQDLVSKLQADHAAYKNETSQQNVPTATRTGYERVISLSISPIKGVFDLQAQYDIRKTLRSYTHEYHVDLFALPCDEQNGLHSICSQFVRISSSSYESIL